MGRFLALILCLCQLVLPAQAKEVKYVALTFDDGPSGKYTQALLDGLYDRGVNATFLLCGYRMKDYPELTQRIFDEGHEIGFHGYSHKNMKNMSRRDIAADIRRSPGKSEGLRRWGRRQGQWIKRPKTHSCPPSP